MEDFSYFSLEEIEEELKYEDLFEAINGIPIWKNAI